MATTAPPKKAPMKITSKGDVMHMDGMRTGGHAAETHHGIYSSVDSQAAEVVAAGAASGVPVDAATARLVVAAAARERLLELLAVNATKYDFKYNVFMHNHGAQLLIAFFRLGADARKLEETFAAESVDYEPAHLSKGRVTADNWRDCVGVDHPPPGPPDFSAPPKPTHYADFIQFFHAQIEEQGAAEVVKMVGSVIADGVAGDLVHAIIELGYAFELPTTDNVPDTSLLARGLAWMCVSYKPLPGLNPSPATQRAPGGEGREISNRDPAAMWAQIRADERIPKMTTATGPMGFDENMGRLAGGSADVLGDYDLEIGADEDPLAVARRVADAIVIAFGATGFRDFFVLHMVTGMRGVESTLPHVDAHAQRSMIRAFWKACVYIYVARGAPSTDASAQYLSAEGVRSWDDIVAGTLAFTDAHLAKLVFLARDNFFGKAKDNVAYQVMADKAAQVIEAGGDWEQF